MERLRSFQDFLIINYNRQGWGAAFSVIIPVGADADTGGSPGETDDGGGAFGRGSSWWGLLWGPVLSLELRPDLWAFTGSLETHGS